MMGAWHKRNNIMDRNNGSGLFVGILEGRYKIRGQEGFDRNGNGRKSLLDIQSPTLCIFAMRKGVILDQWFKPEA